MKTLRQRVLLSVAGGAVFSGVLSLVVVHTSLRVSVAQRMRDLATEPGRIDHAACVAAPASWQEVHGLHQLWSYDPDGRSANPLAPVLAAEDIPARVGDAHLQKSFQFFDQGLVIRLAETGPCAVGWLAPPGAPAALDLLRFNAFVGVFGAALLGLMLTSTVVVRPLIGRIERLDAAAARLSTTEYRPVADPVDDALGRVARTLDRSHARITSDRAALAERGELLERHLAAVAHDLRTPLASLQLTLETLDQIIRSSERPELAMARIEVGSLEALADNLLQASRLNAGLDVRARAARVDWSELVRRVATRFDILGRGRGIEVIAAVPEHALWAGCDPSLAERVLANIVHNAVLHGPADHPVGVALDRTPEGFSLAVHSGGPALSVDRLEALAARRLVAPSASRTRGQDGLGVAIVNEVSRRAGWRVAYLPGEEGGLSVVLTGPVVAPGPG